MFRFKYLFILLLSPLVLACNRDDDDNKDKKDTSAPVISLISPESATATVAAGDTLRVTLRLTDNQNLSQLQVDLHNAFDGHAHGKTNTTTDTLDYDAVMELNGKGDTTLTLKIPTRPSNQPGAYDLIINALDQSGNEAAFLEIEVTLTNSAFPTVSNIVLNKDGSPITGGTDHAHFELEELTKTRLLTGTVTANGGATLREIEVLLVEAADGHAKTLHNGPVELLHLEDLTTASHTLNETLTYQKSTDLGPDTHYDMQLIVTDSQNRSQTFVIMDVHIQY
ncbi:MAG: DUF4625 domain-containing protein [Sphingobacteriia bacterium]|jgi:hypothetical protein